MPQISKGETFADSQQLTATRLNQLVDSAQILVGAITDQPSITANTLEATDSTIVNDAGTLKEATIGDILNSNLPVTSSIVTTSAVNGSANSDVIITPNDAVAVTSKVFTSADGITSVVTSVAHGFQTGQVINITASIAAYSGLYAITVLTVDTFSYKIRQTTPVAASGTCSYTRKGTELVKGSKSTLYNSYIGGSSTIEGSQIVRGNQSIDGNLEVVGTATFNNAPQVLTSVIKPRFDYFVQTRAQAVYNSGWGGLQNLANIYGTKLPLVDITFTPQKAGNIVVLCWSLFGEGYNAASDMVFLVTRTPNSGVGAGVPVHLPDAVDASNNTWSGVTTCGHDGNDATTPSTVTVKIVDLNTLDVSCTYSVYFRSANNRLSYWHFNRAVNGTGGALDLENGLSLGHAHEIYT
jgi:hypothetical protein